MKVLLITSQYIIGHANGKYFHNSLRDHINRYKIFGDITLCSQIVEKKNCNTELDISDIRLCPILPENNILTLVSTIRHNRRVLREEIKNTDFLIVYLPSELGSYALKQARKIGIKTLLVGISCPWDALWNHSWKGKIVAPFRWLATKKAFSTTDYALYVTSEFLQRRYPTKGMSAGISDVVVPVKDDSRLLRRLDHIGNMTFNPDEEIKIVTSAAVNVRYKRQEDVIKAIGVLNRKYNLHYYLIGGGDSSYLRHIAEKNNVADKVHFMGMVDHSKIFELLENMDLYIQPSKQEGLPRALVEAMSCALPCIGSSTGGIPELLDSSAIFCRGNIDSLVKVLEKNMDVNVLKSNATACFNKAAEFQTEILDEKRDDFFGKIKNELECSLR